MADEGHDDDEPHSGSEGDEGSDCVEHGHPSELPSPGSEPGGDVDGDESEEDGEGSTDDSVDGSGSETLDDDEPDPGSTVVVVVS